MKPKYITEFAPSCGFGSTSPAYGSKQVRETLANYLNSDPHPGYKLLSCSAQTDGPSMVWHNGKQIEDTWNEFVLVWELKEESKEV